MISAPVWAPRARQNSVERPSSVKFWVGSFTSGGTGTISSFVFFSICFFRKRWNSAWRSTFWSRLSRAFSASVAITNGASAILSLPRRGSRGFNGSFSLTCATPADAERAESMETRINATTRPTALTPSFVLRATGRLSRGPRVGRVELGEPRVVAPDVRILRVELEGALVLRERSSELAFRLERDREVVVRPGVVRLLLDGLLEPESRFAPESPPGHRASEGDLRLRLLGAGVRGAPRRHENGSENQRSLLQTRILDPQMGRLL